MATTSGGTPYVTSTDLVANYPTASLSLANRADVIASGGPVLVKTSGYTITVADILAGNKFLYNSASSGTFTLPTSSLVDGMVVEVAQIGAGALTVSGGTIVGTAATSVQYQALTFIYVASGTTWYAVSQGTSPGLSLVTTSTVSAASTVSINNCFTSTYDNYRIVYNFDTSATGKIYFRYRASGTDNTSNSYRWQHVDIGGATIAGYRSLGTAAEFAYSVNTLGGSPGSADVFAPALTRVSWTSGAGISNQSTMNPWLVWTDFDGTTAFDGFTLYPASGTMTGSVSVYGYKK